jgi:nucleotide-binding universal stress UspA family protein
MFKHLLVPLDGTPMAEAAAVVAAGLLRGEGVSPLRPAGVSPARVAGVSPASVSSSGSFSVASSSSSSSSSAPPAGPRVTLVHVLEESSPQAVHGQRHLSQPGESEEYLRELAARVFPPGADVRCHVHHERTSHVAESLAFHAEELQPDLIVLCSHGGVRLRDRLRGNIAQQVVSKRVTPVLLLQVPQGGEVSFPFARVLAPVDGQEGHECALAPAVDLAEACGAEMLLLTVVQTPGVLRGRRSVTDELLPAATQEIVAMNEEKAAEYLEKLVLQLRARGLVVLARVVRGDPAREIIRAAEEWQADLVALGTHGRAGTDAFWAGTVTPKLLRRLKSSFLLAPVPEGDVIS